MSSVNGHTADRPSQGRTGVAPPRNNEVLVASLASNLAHRQCKAIIRRDIFKNLIPAMQVSWPESPVSTPEDPHVQTRFLQRPLHVLEMAKFRQLADLV